MTLQVMIGTSSKASLLTRVLSAGSWAIVSIYPNRYPLHLGANLRPTKSDHLPSLSGPTKHSTF